MSKQSASTSNISAPSTPSSSNQQGKTQVFILTPDILKKLGIANKIPNFATSSGNVSNIKSTAQVKKVDVNLDENIKNKLVSVLNKKVSESSETKNQTETKKYDNSEGATKCDEKEKCSVKSKLLSMLTSKSEKVKSTVCSVETKKETTKLENQIKSKENITLNLKETTSSHNINKEEKSLLNIEKRETDVKIKELNKNDIKTEIILETNTNREPVHKINETIQNIDFNNTIQSNKNNTKEILATKNPVQSTSVLKNLSSSEISNKNIKTENEHYFNIKISGISNAVVLSENEDNKTCGTEVPKHKESNEQGTILVLSPVEKTTPRGKKRKIHEESPHEVSSVRKSARKRKLSTLHNDYVTELKLHDGLSQKISSKGRKSTEMKIIENSDKNITKDINDLNKNNNVTSELSTSDNKSKTNNETRKITEESKEINSAQSKNLSTSSNIISKTVSVSKNIVKEIGNENPILQLNIKSPHSDYNKFVSVSKSLLENQTSKIKSNIAEKEVSQETYSVADNVFGENIDTDMEKVKSNQELATTKYEEIKLKENTPLTPASPDKSLEVITNKNESNNNIGNQLATDSHISTNKDNTELSKQIVPNIYSSPKKQIIIHENILIKSCNINKIPNLNTETKHQDNMIKSSIESLSSDSLLNNENTIVLIKENTINDDDTLNLKIKYPLKTYPGKIKARLSTDAEHTGKSKLSHPDHNQTVEKISPVDSSLNTENTTISIRENTIDDSSINFIVKSPLKTYSGKTKGRLPTDAEYIVRQSSSDMEPNGNIQELKITPCVPNKNISAEKIVTKIVDSPVKIEMNKKIEEKPNIEVCYLLNNKPNKLNISACRTVPNENISEETDVRKIDLSVKIDTKIEETHNEIDVPLKIIPVQPNLTGALNESNANMLIGGRQSRSGNGNSNKRVSPVQNLLSSVNLPEVEMDSSIRTTETNQSIQGLNIKQDLLSASETPTPLTVAISLQGGRKENKPESDTCDSLIVTETKTSANVKQEVLKDSETSSFLTMPVPKQIKPPKQIKNVLEFEDNISVSETYDSPIDTGTKTSADVEKEILKDSETPSLLTILVPKEIKNILEFEVNISGSETCNSPVDTGTKTSANAKQEVLKDSETSSLLTLSVPKPIKYILESEVNSSESETCDSPIDTGIKTSVNVTQEVIMNKETSMSLEAPKRRRGRQPRKKIEELSASSKPKTCDSPIATETKTIVNITAEVIMGKDTPTSLEVPTRKRGRQPRIKIEELAASSEQETCDSPIATETKTIVNVAPEVITGKETSTSFVTPTRRRGRKPRMKIEELAASPEQETSDSSIATETKTIVNYVPEVITGKENPTSLETSTRRGRQPRMKIEESAAISEPETLHSSTVENEPDQSIADETHSETTPVKHGRGRRKREIKGLPQEENYNPDEIVYQKIPRKGRKRNIDEVANNVNAKKSKYSTCAVCKETVSSTYWTNHSMKHNFLCWKVGEPAIDMKNKKLVEYVLFKGLKDNKLFKQFTCPHCEDKKKSVLGFMAHIEICQLSEEERMAMMASCTVCDKKVMPQSMKSHMKIHEFSSKKVPTVEKTLPDNDNEDTPRAKRKAAAKAVNLIQEVTNQEKVVVKKDGKKHYKQVKDPVSIFITFGVIKRFQSAFNKGAKKCRFENCNFESDNFAELKSHLNTCPTLKDDDYICRHCFLVERDESAMKEHVRNNHKDNFTADMSRSESDDDAYGDNEINSSEEEPDNILRIKKISKPATDYLKPAYKIAFLAKERRIIRNPICTYLPALRWTSEFISENYSQRLFESIKCLASNWTLVSLSEQEKYLPRSKKSMSVKTCPITYTLPNLQNKEHEWKEYDMFETSLNDDTATIFCGGPIWALAWVPTPMDSNCDQYLAVSVQKDFEATYKISESYTGHELIQIWNFGPLDTRVLLKSTPTLEFSIAHNHGMVWCMEWCPSGCYETTDPTNPNEFRKLGLLALACSDGNIPIYAFGFPHKNEKVNHNIFNVKPAIKLVLQDPMEQLLGRWKYQATKLSWSKGSGHNIIAGGYSNGVVCLWDLECTSPLLRTEENGIIILKPYHSFQAHAAAISALIVYPLINKGKRWLLTGAWDRTLKYWDINNTTIPISTYGKRGMITDAVWISHWLCSFSSFDDVFSLGHTVTTVQNPRFFGFRQCSALASNSFVMSLSANDWASAVAQGTLAGELTTTFPRTILISYDVDKHLKCKRMMLSYSEIIDKTLDVSERKDIMMTEDKSNESDNERDEKLFSRYLMDNDKKEPYVEQPSTYEEVREKFGMLFCDFKLGKFNYLPDESLKMVRQSSRLREVPTEMYPFTSLNRVVWNPNKQAYLYVASGYQNGFVRLRCIRFMNTKIGALAPKND